MVVVVFVISKFVHVNFPFCILVDPEIVHFVDDLISDVIEIVSEFPRIKVGAFKIPFDNVNVFPFKSHFVIVNVPPDTFNVNLLLENDDIEEQVNEPDLNSNVSVLNEHFPVSFDHSTLSTFKEQNKTTTNQGLFENLCIDLKNNCLVANINPLFKMKHLN